MGQRAAEVRTLLVQTSFLGDTVLSTPLIAAIKHLYPESKLWIMTTPLSSHLVKRDPLIEGVIEFDKRRSQRGILGLLRMSRFLRTFGFTQVYSLHRSFRTSLLLYWSGIARRVGFQHAKGAFLYTERVERANGVHDVLRNLSLLSNELDSLEEHADLRLIPPPKSELGKEVLQSLEDEQPYYVVFPGSVWKTKRWYWQHYQRVIAHYLEKGKKIIILGGPEDGSLAQKICDSLGKSSALCNLVGCTSISETMYIVSNASLVICNDSMSLHLASAFHIPNVSIFCATSPTFGFGPWRNNALVVEKEGLECKPCRRHGSNTCPTGTESCMKDVTPGEVIAAADKVLLA